MTWPSGWVSSAWSATASRDMAALTDVLPGRTLASSSQPLALRQEVVDLGAEVSPLGIRHVESVRLVRRHWLTCDAQLTDGPVHGDEQGARGRRTAEDGRAGVPLRVVAQEPAGKRRAAAELDGDDGRPGGGRLVELPRSQFIVSRSDPATGRPMPWLANQAYPPPSAIGGRTSVNAGSAGRCCARAMMSYSLLPCPWNRTTSGAAGFVGPAVETTGSGSSVTVRRLRGRSGRRCGRRSTGRARS